MYEEQKAESRKQKAESRKQKARTENLNGPENQPDLKMY
jgi:hypothetical protein